MARGSLSRQASAADYPAWLLDSATTTTLSETGGGGAAGTPVVFTATVADSGDPAYVPTGTVTFYDNGSATPLGTATLAGGVATFTYTFARAGAHSVVAVYNPSPCSPWCSSKSCPVTFTQTAPTSTCGCADEQTIEATIAGTLAIYTPYTSARPLNLSTLVLNAAGTYFTADSTFSGITVVDTQAGNLPWTVTALASNLGDGGPDAGSTISAQDVGLTRLAAVTVPGNALTAADLAFTNQPAASPPVTPGNTGHQGLGGSAAHTIVADSQQADGTVGINGTVTVNAPTSTEAGLFVGTITFTVAS
jgi:hypothetical protein